MATVRKTKTGWVLEIANTVYGMLEQGGISGREELYKRETLAKYGIDYDTDPAGYDVCEHVTNVDWLRRSVGCDKVLKAGHIIQ
jgi:hypothetical protein